LEKRIGAEKALDMVIAIKVAIVFGRFSSFLYLPEIEHWSLSKPFVKIVKQTRVQNMAEVS
jgi:hypothetical protein